MMKECPNCKEEIEYLEVSKQIEGTQQLSMLDKKEPLHPIEWKPPEEQYEPLIYTCHKCLVEIDDKTLEEWGVK